MVLKGDIVMMPLLDRPRHVGSVLGVARDTFCVVFFQPMLGPVGTTFPWDHGFLRLWAYQEDCSASCVFWVGCRGGGTVICYNIIYNISSL